MQRNNILRIVRVHSVEPEDPAFRNFTKLCEYKEAPLLKKHTLQIKYGREYICVEKFALFGDNEWKREQKININRPEQI